MSNNRKIESQGVNYLSTFIDSHDLLQSYFDKNDKTPLLDGEIHILKAPTEKKEDIIGKVPVQIKATKQYKRVLSSFPLNIKDLEFHLKDGGFILFVVWLDEENSPRGIYYKSLPPLTIKHLIKKSKHKSKFNSQKRLSVSLFSVDKKELYPMLVDFIRSRTRQYSFVTSDGLIFDNLPNNKSFKFYHSGNSPISVFEYQKKHELFAYVKDDETGIEIPIENPIVITDIASTTDLTFTIGDSFIFKNITRHYSSDGSVELIIGSGFKITCDDKYNKFTLNYSRPDKLSEAIKCTEALLELHQKEYVFLNDSKIDFDNKTISEIESMNLPQHLEELKKISSFMNSMGVEKDIDLSLLDEQSHRNLNVLHKGFILKEKVNLRFDESKLLHLHVANVHFMTLFQLEGEGIGELINLFTGTPWCRVDEGDKKFDISIFEVFEPNDWLKIDHCDFDAVIASYQRLVDNNLLIGDGANNTIIKIISAADKPTSADRKSSLFNWAQRLSKWNLNHTKDMSRAQINDLQIKTRIRELNDEENELLTNILIENNKDIEICFGASVLLKSKAQADFYWKKLDSDAQNRFKAYPIYGLYDRL